MDLPLQRRRAEQRAQRYGHELAAWTPLRGDGKNAGTCYVADCQYCGLQAFAHARFTHYGETATRPCITVLELFKEVMAA